MNDELPTPDEERDASRLSTSIERGVGSDFESTSADSAAETVYLIRASAVEPISDEALDRVWSRVIEAPARRPRSRSRLAFAFAGFCAASIAVSTFVMASLRSAVSHAPTATTQTVENANVRELRRRLLATQSATLAKTDVEHIVQLEAATRAYRSAWLSSRSGVP